MSHRAWHVEADRLRIREGGGCLALFGVPFFGAGVFLCLASAGIIPVNNREMLPSFGPPLILAMGVVFSLVGGGLVFGRSWTTVEGLRRSVSKEWGLLVPMKRRIRRIADSDKVVFTFKEGDSDTADVYPVRIRCRSGESVLLTNTSDYADALAIASAAARLLGVPVEDATTDHRLSLDPADAARPLNERLTRSRQPVESVSRPAEMRSQIHEEGGRTRIFIPHNPTHPLLHLLALIPVAFAAAAVSAMTGFFRETNTPAVVSWVFLGFVTVMFGLLPVIVSLNGYLRARRGGTIVTVSSERLLIEDRGAWRTTPRASIRAGDIFGIDYSTSDSAARAAREAGVDAYVEARGVKSDVTIGPQTERMLAAMGKWGKGRGITVKWRGGMTSVGQGLSDPEVRFLHAVFLDRLGVRSGPG